MAQHSAQLDINLDMNTRNTIQQLQALERLFARIDAVTKNVSHNVSEIAAYDFNKQYEGLAKIINQLSSAKDANALANALGKISGGATSVPIKNKNVADLLTQINQIAPIFNMVGAGGRQPAVLRGYGPDITKVASATDLNSKTKITEAFNKFIRNLTDAQIQVIAKNFDYVKYGINANVAGDTGRRQLVTFQNGISRLRDLVISKQTAEIDKAEAAAQAQIMKSNPKNLNEKLRMLSAEYNTLRREYANKTTAEFGGFTSAMDIFASNFKGFNGNSLKSYLIGEGAKTPKWWAKSYKIGTDENNPNSSTINEIAASMNNLKIASSGVRSYIIGLSDAEIALAQNSGRTNALLAQQSGIVDANSTTARKLTEELKKLNAEQKALNANTIPQSGFTKSRINDAVAAFTKTQPTASSPQSIAGVPFWIKEYFEGENGRIFFSEGIAKKFGRYTAKQNPYYGASTAGVFGENIKGGYDTIYDKMAQAIRSGDMGSFDNIRTMLKYQGQSGAASSNILMNPKKFAEDFERNIASKFTVYVKVLEALNLGGDTAINPYKKLIEQFQSATRNADGSYKSAEELKNLFTSKEFADIYLRRAKSNISNFEKTVLSGLSDAQKEAILQEIGNVNMFGRTDATGDPRKLYTGNTKTIIESVSREGGIKYFAGTEREYLYKNYNMQNLKTQRDVNAEYAKAIPLFDRVFDTKRTETYTGALNNLWARSKQVMYDVPNILQTLNLSYTKAAFAISRVAYGVRIISMEMMALGMTAKNIFSQMIRNVVGYTDSITKATETQAKARITLTGVFNPKMAKDMVEFAKQYAVTSPATFGEVTQMLKSFGLTPQIKDMITQSKDLTSTLKELSYVTVGLASTKPQQGIQGAMFAIREAMSGQFVSLKRRFEISPEVIASMVGRSKSELAKDPQLFIEGMKRFLDLNVGEDTLQKLAMTYEVQINNIKDFMERAQAMIGEAGFYDMAIKSANRIADAFAGILDTNLFKEKMKDISGSLMSISDSIVNGVSDMINRVIKMDDSATASQIKANLLKDDKNKKMSDSEIDKRVKYGLSLIRISSAISMGFTILANTTQKVVEWFNKLTEGIKLDEKALVYYAGIIGELVDGFVNLAGKLIKLYSNYVQWVSSLQLSNDFLRGALLMMGAFPVATMNIAINTFRALFESILSIANPVVWESFGRLTMNLRQFSGELVNTAAAALSFKGARTELDVLFGGMPMARKYQRQRVDASGALMYSAGAPLMEMVEEMVNIPAVDMTKFTNRLQKAFATMWINALTGARLLMAGAVGAIVVSAIAEGIGEGNTGIKKAVLRVVGLFSYIGKGIETVFGTGWIGTVVKSGGFLAMLFPVASYNLIITMIGGLKSAIIGMFTAIMANPAMLAWMASLGLAVTAAGYAYKAGSKSEEVSNLQYTLDNYENYRKAKNKLYMAGGRPLPQQEQWETENIIKQFESRILDNSTIKARLGLMAQREQDPFGAPGKKMLGTTEEFTAATIQKFSKDFLERAFAGLGGKDEVSILDSFKEAFTGMFPGIKALEKEGETTLGNFSNMFDFFDRKSGDAMSAMQTAFEAAKERATTLLKSVTKEAEPNDPLKELTKSAMQKEKALDSALTPVKELIAKYDKEDKGYAVKEVAAMQKTFEKLRPAIIEARAEVLALNTAMNIARGSTGNLYQDMMKFGGLSFIIPIILQLQWAEQMANTVPAFMPGVSAGYKAMASAIKYQLTAVLGTRKTAGKEVDETIGGGLSKAAKAAAEKGGGADKAAEQKQKYESMMKTLENEILDAQDRAIEARVRAAAHERERKLSEVEQEFKGTKYYEELKTKVVEAEAAKRMKIEDDIRKDLYSKIAESKFSSVESVMKAYGWLQGKERTKDINNITDALKNNIISQGVANELLAEADSLYRSNMIEKYYETLKKQPSLADILGGKDAEKVLNNFNVKLADYVKISEKNLNLIKNAKVQWDLISAEKTKDAFGTTTTQTYQLMGKIPSSGVEGDAASATRTAMDTLRTAYYQNSIMMLKMEIEQEKKLSDEQMKRMSNNDFEKRFGVTKEYAVLLRDIIAQTRILAQAEEQYYKMKEQKMQQTNSMAEQMNFALTEQVRKLPTQYDTVKSETESMFNTLRDGLSNTLVAAFSGDVEKMKDTWKEFITTLKNTFLKMIADLIVNNLLKSLFSGLMGKEEAEKGAFLKNAIGGMGGGQQSGLMTILPGIQLPNPASLVQSITDPMTMASTTTAASLTSSLVPSIGVATGALTGFATAVTTAATSALAMGGGGGEDGGLFSGLFDFGGMEDLGDGIYNSGSDIIVNADEWGDGYADGGIVSAPTRAWIGEGSMSEAVVPLPNGRAIPVDMKGNTNAAPAPVTVINVLEASLMEEYIANNPDAIINIISADSLKGGKTYQAMRAKSGK